MRIEYVAFDGERFETKEGCLQHESKGGLIEVRLHFHFFEDEISDLYTKWIKFNDTLNFKAIDSILGQEYRYLLADIAIKTGLSEDYVEDLITQIYEGKGRACIEIAPINFRIG